MSHFLRVVELHADLLRAVKVKDPKEVVVMKVVESKANEVKVGA